ncbi:MAG: hypothetical protein C0418_04190 [Coriobacteriaceae bacterium]|nr:hypothetical protein [Coriobacteriaceae bacterium]
MPLVSQIEGMPVVARAGRRVRRLGTVSRVVMHPSEARVIALEVRRPDLLLMFARKPRYVPLSLVSEWGERGVGVIGRRLPALGAAEKEAGAEMDASVVWRGMPVRTRSGEPAGTVADAGFLKSSGGITRVMLSSGRVDDAALGVREVAGGLVGGYDAATGAILVDDPALEAARSGGLAEDAGKGAAVAAKAAVDVAARATETGEALVETGKAAVELGRAAAAAAAATPAGRKAAGAARSLGRAVREAMRRDKDG